VRISRFAYPLLSDCPQLHLFKARVIALLCCLPCVIRPPLHPRSPSSLAYASVCHLCLGPPCLSYYTSSRRGISRLFATKGNISPFLNHHRSALRLIQPPCAACTSVERVPCTMAGEQQFKPRRVWPRQLRQGLRRNESNCEKIHGQVDPDENCCSGDRHGRNL
jgi:hypothetical protein